VNWDETKAGKDAAIWFAALARDGAYKMAKRIVRLESYGAYMKKYGKSDRWHDPKILSLDAMIEADRSDDSQISQIVYEHDMEEHILADLTVEVFAENLSPKQRGIMYKLIEGHRSRDIYKGEGYSSTSGVRYQRAEMRKKYRDYTDGDNSTKT